MVKSVGAKRRARSTLVRVDSLNLDWSYAENFSGGLGPMLHGTRPRLAVTNRLQSSIVSIRMSRGPKTDYY